MKLPVYEIEGTQFQVDVIAREMRECANPANIIGFHEMIDNGESYSFYYDPVDKNISIDTVYPSIYITVPQMRHFDPVTMAMHYNYLVADMNLKTDYEIIVDEELVKLRLGGALPIIKLMDHPFFVDERLGSLRPKDDFRTMGIYFDDMEEINDRELGFVYDPKKHAIAELNLQTITKFPKDLYLLHVPHQWILDPVGWARRHGFDLKEVLRKYPPQKDLRATVIPWRETPLVDIIQKNLWQNFDKNYKNTIKVSTNKKKKGRGI
ncbi:hypothetical protein [Pedobacter sp. WC2423]|uniref:hypothetical protein n=1 Tax=Pedobacter sp. WC2423 TaxID=3234142 RepID=UPI003466C2A1